MTKEEKQVPGKRRPRERTYLGVPLGFQYLQKRYCPSALTR